MVSYYEFVNTQNIGAEEALFQREQQSWDLMSLIMIRIGVETESDTSEIIRFLHGLFIITKMKLKNS